MLGSPTPCVFNESFKGALFIRRLNLTDFRCYEFLRLEADDRPVVVTGPNGAGKTNLLEAISYLVPGRGLRGAKLSDVGRQRSKFDGCAEANVKTHNHSWAVAAQMSNYGKLVEIGTGLRAVKTDSNRERRIIKIDGKTGLRQSELGNFASAIWLTPQMDQLFLAGGSGRRRFVDNLITGINRDHASLVTAYEHSMRSRTKLLKEGERDDKWLGSIEDDMAQYGVAVAARRKDFVVRLNQWAITDTEAFPGARIVMVGGVESLLDKIPAVEVEEKIRTDLANSRSIDYAGKTPIIGPHKSDFAAWHVTNGIEASQCSTGEQKALLIRIILAATCLSIQEKDQVPLLLLDEIAAHLDSVRQAALFDIICKMGIQAWMTGTDEMIYRFLGNRVQRFKINDAKIEQNNIN